MATLSPPAAGEVGTRTAWKSTQMPELGLQLDLSYQYRVYVLQCTVPAGSRGPCYYVGIEYKSKVGAHLVQHFSGRGAFFTKANAPVAIQLVWPACNTAVEGYVFLALLGQMPAGSIQRLGGWTQTSVAPSPLSCMIYEQDRRLMAGHCFKCGGGHYATACQKPVQGLRYKCPHCSGELVISARGQSVSSPATSSSAAAAAATAPQPPSTAVTSASQPLARGASRKRPAPGSSPPARASALQKKTGDAAAPSGGKLVDVCGKKYTSLSWFLGRQNPSPSYCTKARQECYRGALELQGGDLRTLVAGGYARAPPAKPKPLLPDRARLSSQWIDTPITTEHDILKVRKTGATLQKSNRQVLWLVTDLQKCFRQQQ